MTSRRMITEGFFNSEGVGEWTIRQRLLTVGLITFADDQGRIRAHPGWLKSRIFPYDDISHEDIQADLDAIQTTNDTIILYESDGRAYIQLLNWWEYQNLQWAKPSEHPSPDDWSDRIRQMVYQPKRWVMTLNWPGSDDCLSYQDTLSGNVLGNKEGDALPLINTNTNINTKDDLNDFPSLSEYSAAFVSASHIPEQKVEKWIEALKTIRNEQKAQPEHITKAVKQLHEKKFSISGPWSIINAVAIVLGQEDGNQSNKLEDYSYAGS